MDGELVKFSDDNVYLNHCIPFLVPLIASYLAKTLFIN